MRPQLTTKNLLYFYVFKHKPTCICKSRIIIFGKYLSACIIIFNKRNDVSRILKQIFSICVFSYDHVSQSSIINSITD